MHNNLIGIAIDQLARFDQHQRSCQHRKSQLGLLQWAVAGFDPFSISARAWSLLGPKRSCRCSYEQAGSGSAYSGRRASEEAGCQYGGL